MIHFEIVFFEIKNIVPIYRNFHVKVVFGNYQEFVFCNHKHTFHQITTKRARSISFCLSVISILVLTKGSLIIPTQVVIEKVYNIEMHSAVCS